MKGSLSWKPTPDVGRSSDDDRHKRPSLPPARGGGGGPLLLLLHGAAHSGWFQWMIPRLATRYRVVAPDLRGSGRTGHADRYTWEDYAADIEALVDLLVGNRHDLAGHCSGGYIGMLIAARGRRPPAALVGMEILPPCRRATGSQRRTRGRGPDTSCSPRSTAARQAIAPRRGPAARPRRGARARALDRRASARWGGWVPRIPICASSRRGTVLDLRVSRQVPRPTCYSRGTASGQLNRIRSY